MKVIDLLERIEGRTFQNANITLDGRFFIKCNFNSCNLIYSGGLVETEECNFDFTSGTKLITLGPMKMAQDNMSGEDVKAALLISFERVQEKLRGEPGVFPDGSFRF